MSTPVNSINNYEYKTHCFYHKLLTEQTGTYLDKVLNEYASQGWEFIGNVAPGTGAFSSLVFRRVCSVK
jgi:hypothetical protein